MSLKYLLIVQFLFGLSTFDAVLAASLPEAACTSCTQAGIKVGVNANTEAGINAGTDAGIGSGFQSFKLKITLSEA